LVFFVNNFFDKLLYQIFLTKSFSFFKIFSTIFSYNFDWIILQMFFINFCCKRFMWIFFYVNRREEAWVGRGGTVGQTHVCGSTASSPPCGRP
jgi:hypothetical protein